MTWRKEPYPYTEGEIETFKKWWEKYNNAVALMEKLKIPYDKITRYPFGFPDGMVSIMDLYEIISDPEKWLQKIKK
jgi:hypothetical protein